VESIGDDTLFSFHEKPNPACPIGRSIHTILDGRLDTIQRAMERAMETVTLADLVKEARMHAAEPSQ
jgi:rrf2 family transcriptional regulator